MYTLYVLQIFKPRDDRCTVTMPTSSVSKNFVRLDAFSDYFLIIILLLVLLKNFSWVSLICKLLKVCLSHYDQQSVDLYVVRFKDSTSEIMDLNLACKLCIPLVFLRLGALKLRHEKMRKD